MRRVDLAQYLERQRDAGAIEIVLGDGTSIVVPPAELWSDLAFKAIEAQHWLEATREILGDDYEAFVAAGGNWRVLNGILEESQGLGAPE